VTNSGRAPVSKEDEFSHEGLYQEDGKTRNLLDHSLDTILDGSNIEISQGFKTWLLRSDLSKQHIQIAIHHFIQSKFFFGALAGSPAEM